MRIGILHTGGINCKNGADYVAEFLANAVVADGHELVLLGSHGGAQVEDIPDGLDFLVQSSSWGLHTRHDLVKKFKEKTIVTMWTHNDEMERWREPIGGLTNLVDIHFSYTKQHNWGDHVVYLPIGADHTLFYPTEDREKTVDICLIGWKHDWRGKFMDIIQRQFPNCFTNYTMSLPFSNLNTVYNKTKVVLAPVQDCDVNNPGHAWGCPCRTFDVPASNAFQIQVEREGLKDVYPMAVTLPAIADVYEAAAAWSEEINYWLEHPKEREEKAQEMYEHTMDNHLYVHRLRKMIECVKEYSRDI